MRTGVQLSEAAVVLHRQSVASRRAFHYSAVKLLIALGLLFLSAPFIEDLPQGDLIEAMLLTLVSTQSSQ